MALLQKMNANECRGRSHCRRSPVSASPSSWRSSSTLCATSGSSLGPPRPPTSSSGNCRRFRTISSTASTNLLAKSRPIFNLGRKIKKFCTLAEKLIDEMYRGLPWVAWTRFFCVREPEGWIYQTLGFVKGVAWIRTYHWSWQSDILPTFAKFEFEITFTRVLDAGESNLGSLGFLHGQLAISLGITCVVVFIFIAASTQSLGKVNVS